MIGLTSNFMGLESDVCKIDENWLKNYMFLSFVKMYMYGCKFSSLFFLL